MSGTERSPSVPAWTALHPSSRSTAAPSERSSTPLQEMNDELAESPSPSPPPSPDNRKRKGGTRIIAGPTAARKRSRLDRNDASSTGNHTTADDDYTNTPQAAIRHVARKSTSGYRRSNQRRTIADLKGMVGLSTSDKSSAKLKTFHESTSVLHRLGSATALEKDVIVLSDSDDSTPLAHPGIRVLQPAVISEPIVISDSEPDESSPLDNEPASVDKSCTSPSEQSSAEVLKPNIDQEFLRAHQSYCVIPSQPPLSTKAGLSPSLEGKANPQQLGSPGLGDLVPALGDMALGGSSAALQAVSEHNVFENWDSGDSSIAAGTRSASEPIEDTQLESMQPETLLEPPSTPAPRSTTQSIGDVDLVAVSAKDKLSRRKSDLKRMSGSRFNFTPISPIQLSSPGGPIHLQDQRMQSPISPTVVARKRLPLPPVEVVGSLYSGEKGFFKAVRSRQSSGNFLSHDASAASLIPSLLPVQIHPTSTEAQASTTQHTERYEEKKPPLPIPRLAAHRPSRATAAIVQPDTTAQTCIDLTQSSDDEVDDVQDAIASARLLADLIPEMMADHPSATPLRGGIPAVSAATHQDEQPPSPQKQLAATLLMASFERQLATHTVATAEEAHEQTSDSAPRTAREPDAAQREDTADQEEDTVIDLLCAGSRDSPDPLETTGSAQDSGRVTRYRAMATRSSSNSSSVACRPDSPAPATPPDALSGTDFAPNNSTIPSALVSRLSHVHMSSDDDEDYGMTWQSFGVKTAREYADVRLLAKDLPHSLQDIVNTLPEHCLQMEETTRLIFTNIISINTANDEPTAPPIDVINDVDHEPCPPFEFYYTNLMWHSEAVPKPDFSKLQGCGCFGDCSDPRICACARKQKEHHPYLLGLAYNTQKRLRPQARQYPVYECNDLCQCDESCRNRVVQLGRKCAINIKKTPNKGWGVFAGQRISQGSFIGIYAGEYLTNSEGDTRGMTYNLGNRTYLFDIDFWFLKEDEADTKYCVDAYHAGNFTRYLNHSCDPNCILMAVYINEPDKDKPLLAVFAERDIPAGDELCFSYYGPPEDDDGSSVDDDDDAESPVDSQEGIFTKCLCGAAKCKGKMWKSHS